MVVYLKHGHLLRVEGGSLDMKKATEALNLGGSL
jgi:hypothetical protein